jgi:hypothetical protein
MWLGGIIVCILAEREVFGYSVTVPALYHLSAESTVFYTRLWCLSFWSCIYALRMVAGWEWLVGFGKWEHDR